MQPDHNNHPCFNAGARHTSARIHLPVAPECNVQCRFCNRNYDCINESRPGVTSTLLTPKQALAYCKEAMERHPEISVIGIAGPGDPFATPERTIETLALVRESFPEMLLCVASNGLALPEYVPELSAIDVSHVTITVNGIDPATVCKVYRWIRHGKRMLHGDDGARSLIEQQYAAIRGCKEHGITVKVNAIMIPGINDHCIAAIAEKVASLGADLFNCIPLLPAAGTDFEGVAEPSIESVNAIRAEAEKFLPQMRHCSRCRADAVGLLGKELAPEMIDLLKQHAAPVRATDTTAVPRIAVATLEGVMVNQHLGNARLLSIFENSAKGPVCIDERETPPSGDGAVRWHALAKILDDCQTILVQFAGAAPRAVLREHNIEVVAMEGRILPALNELFAGRPVPAYLTAPAPKRCGAGAGCGGNGGGCGA